MQRALARYVIADDHERANYSLRLSDDRRTFHVLYRGSCVAVASPDPQRIVTALVRHLDAHAGTPDGLVGVQAVALLRDDRAMLVPTLLEDDLRALSRQLGREGIQILDTHTVFVDLSAGEVVVTSDLEVDDGALADVVSLAPPSRRSDPPVRDGRYPLARWLLMELWQRPGRYSRATATRRAALVLRGGPRAAGHQPLDRLAELFETVPADGIAPKSRREILSLARDPW